MRVIKGCYQRFGDGPQYRHQLVLAALRYDVLHRLDQRLQRRRLFLQNQRRHDLQHARRVLAVCQRLEHFVFELADRRIVGVVLYDRLDEALESACKVVCVEVDELLDQHERELLGLVVVFFESLAQRVDDLGHAVFDDASVLERDPLRRTVFGAQLYQSLQVAQAGQS